MPKKDYSNQEWTVADFKVPGFAEALTEALGPHVSSEPNVTEVENLIGGKLVKAAKKYNKDERRDQQGNAPKAQALIEEFVDVSMSSVSAALHDKTWWMEVNFTGPLLALALFTFDGAKVFRRTVGPMIEKYVEAGIFKWREEDRIQKVMSNAVEESGVKEAYKKRALKHLSTAYDEQHFKAPYGTLAGETQEMGNLKAFIKGWMLDFTTRAWDVLDNGIGQGEGSTRDEKVLFTTVIYQALADGKSPCLPFDLVSAVGEVPPSPWAWVAEMAETVFQELEAQEEATRQKKLKLAQEAAAGK